MSKCFYQVVILLGALTWLSAGMRLSRVLATLDAGGRPDAIDWMLLAGTAITGILSAFALLEFVKLAAVPGVSGRDAAKG